MSKITNDSLTKSGTVCFIAVSIWQQWASKGWMFADNIRDKWWPLSAVPRRAGKRLSSGFFRAAAAVSPSRHLSWSSPELSPASDELSPAPRPAAEAYHSSPPSLRATRQTHRLTQPVFLFNYYRQAVGAAKAWFSERLDGWDTPAGPHMRPVLLIVILLIAHATGLSCSKPAYSTAKLRLHAGNFCEKCHFLVTTTLIDIKPSRCPAQGLYTSACKISPSYETAFRRR